jgi:hypothetical protein
MQAAKKTNVKFRNLGSHGDRVLDSVQWKTLTRIYQFGLSVGLSRSQGDELLKMISRDSNEAPVVLVVLPAMNVAVVMLNFSSE